MPGPPLTRSNQRPVSVYTGRTPNNQHGDPEAETRAHLGRKWTASVGLDIRWGANEPSPDMNTTVAKATFCFDETILRVVFLFLSPQPSVASHLSVEGRQAAALARPRLCKDNKNICNPNER